MTEREQQDRFERAIDASRWIEDQFEGDVFLSPLDTDEDEFGRMVTDFSLHTRPCVGSSRTELAWSLVRELRRIADALAAKVVEEQRKRLANETKHLLPEGVRIAG